MKKFYIIVSLIVMSIGCSVLADVVTTTRRINRPEPQHSVQNQLPTARPTTSNKLVEKVKMCTPYTESLQTEIAGMDFLFNIKISGWIDNKCRLDFVAKSTGVNDIFKSLYGIDASQATISTFEPKVRCDFTKQQLEAVGDSILQENARRAGATNNMLKNPRDINLPSYNDMTKSDMALLDILSRQNACKVLNVDNSSELFNSIFSY